MVVASWQFEEEPEFEGKPGFSSVSGVTWQGDWTYLDSISDTAVDLLTGGAGSLYDNDVSSVPLPAQEPPMTTAFKKSYTTYGAGAGKKAPLEGPATPAQLGYLSSLVEKKEDPTKIGMKFSILKATGAIKESGGTWTNVTGSLSKQTASDWISTLIAAPKKTVVTMKAEPPVSGPISGAWSSAPSAAPSQASIPEEGYYEVETGQYPGVYAFLTKEKKDWQGVKFGVKVLMKLTVKKVYEADGYTQKIDPATGKPVVKGSWSKYGGVALAKKILAGQTPMTKADAMTFGKKYTFCVRCGRWLSDPTSVAQSLGPVCMKYFV